MLAHVNGSYYYGAYCRKCKHSAQDKNWRVETLSSEDASDWLLMPSKQQADMNVPPPNPATMTKTWIIYDGARIEIALFNHYRVLYDPVRDEYIHFWIHRVDAD